MNNKSIFSKLSASFASTVVLASFLIPSVVEAKTFSWKDLWDADSEQTVRTFSDVEASGIDITVSYSDNQIWQKIENHKGLNLYERARPPILSSHNDYHSLWIYDGILRMTNNTSNVHDPATVTIDFSQAVDLDDFWLGSLGLTRRGTVREWMRFTAFDKDSNIVNPSKVAAFEDFFHTSCTDTRNREGDTCHLDGADNPDYVQILPQSDGSVLLRGLGDQADKEYGRTFFAVEGVTRVKVEFFATDADDDNQLSNIYTSAAVGNTFSFEPSEPPTDVGNAVAIADNITFSSNESMPPFNILANDLNNGDSPLNVAEVNGSKLGSRVESFTLPSGSTIIIRANGELDYTPADSLRYLVYGDSVTESFSYTVIGEDGTPSTATVALNLEGYIFAD